MKPLVCNSHKSTVTQLDWLVELPAILDSLFHKVASLLANTKSS